MIISLMTLGMSCSSSSKASIRKFQSRRYRLCKQKEVKNPIGKACFRYCSKYKFLHPKKSKNCKEWKVLVEDFSDPKVHEKFRNANFVLINEERIL
jgi:hypothetical protein